MILWLNICGFPYHVLCAQTFTKKKNSITIMVRCWLNISWFSFLFFFQMSICYPQWKYKKNQEPLKIQVKVCNKKNDSLEQKIQDMIINYRKTRKRNFVNKRLYWSEIYKRSIYQTLFTLVYQLFSKLKDSFLNKKNYYIIMFGTTWVIKVTFFFQK